MQRGFVTLRDAVEYSGVSADVYCMHLAAVLCRYRSGGGAVDVGSDGRRDAHGRVSVASEFVCGSCFRRSDANGSSVVDRCGVDVLCEVDVGCRHVSESGVCDAARGGVDGGSVRRGVVSENGGDLSTVASQRRGCDVDGIGVQGGASGSGDGVSALPFRSVMSSEVGTSVGVKYVPPQKRGPNGGVSIGRGPNYVKNQGIRERKKHGRTKGKAEVDVGVAGCGRNSVVGSDSTYHNKASFFDGLPRGQVNELQRTRAEAMLKKNKAEVRRMELACMRADAEEEVLRQDIESGAFANRIRARNEAADRRSQDQSENVECYRRVQGWAQTVKSGEASSARKPSDVPSLSSGGSPKSESDWELEVHRRDEQNAALREENAKLRKENAELESSVGYGGLFDAQSASYGPCDAFDGASRFDADAFIAEYMEKQRSGDWSVPLKSHIRPKV